MNKHSQTASWRSGAPIPRHVAIIMDGNGRWAERRGLPRSAGHSMGVEAVRRTVRAAMELGLQYLTIYSFSSENWARPASEIDDLMGLMRRFIRRDLAELNDNGVRISVIAERVLAGEMTPQEITPEALSAALDTHGLPDPDLLIRTSGELRLSNFLLWQSAYTEFVFLDAFWPDFGRELLQQAIDEFRRRNRRFGGVTARSTV